MQNTSRMQSKRGANEIWSERHIRTLIRRRRFRHRPCLLSLALDLSHPPEREDLVGSERFMAIGILGGDNATYRHDLESVFYVFIWIAICHDGETSEHAPDESRPHAWLETHWLASSHATRNNMQPATSSKWMEEEFSDDFKPCLPLARKLDGLLFPVRNGKMFIGTDLGFGETQQLYGDMMTAFMTAADC